jgi:hypothetical protein
VPLRHEAEGGSALDDWVWIRRGECGSAGSRVDELRSSSYFTPRKRRLALTTQRTAATIHLNDLPGSTNYPGTVRSAVTLLRRTHTLTARWGSDYIAVESAI